MIAAQTILFRWIDSGLEVTGWGWLAFFFLVVVGLSK